MVYMCVVYNGSPMLLFKAQVGMMGDYVWPLIKVRPCRGTEADVIKDIAIEVTPECLRRRCNECSVVIETVLKHIKGDVDFWFRHIVALYGNWWIPSMGNMRAFHVVVSLSAKDVRRAELATLFVQADHVQKRKRWLAKRVLDQWFRFVAWRRRA